MPPLSVQFTDTSTGTPTAWQWDFNNDGTVDSDVQNPSYAYSTAGTYAVRLTATNAVGTDDEVKSGYITVDDLQESSSGGSSSGGFVSTGTSTTGSTETGSTETGSTETGTSIAGTSTAGTSTIGTSTIGTSTIGTSTAGSCTDGSCTDGTCTNGTCTNGSSGVDSISNVTSGNASLGDGFLANFTAYPTLGEAPLIVQFNDTSTGSITSCLWDFGDGSTSTEQNPIHTYPEIGNYSVTLNASNIYDYSVLAWTDYIKVTEEGESNGDGTGSSDTDGWGYTDTGAIAGGGGSPEPASNIDTTVLTQRFITAGSRIRYNFTQDATCIDFVEFDAKKTLGKATTIIEQLKGRSVLTPSEPGGTVYRYMNIWVGNEGFASPENIENAVIGFRISKAEIPVNETDNSTVVLHRYASG